ncbi:hypothetical protein SELMODRAFT_426843 [Selaginella moellendorffii]|uniref:RING-type E3 ubiquitin transferase n=1 Tax=Selaginella moellendorffii TaxID=88036 RepID=D8SXP2_SELML|nr:putative E3 ubiquitin-protein ligase LIN [Selaginella moellendorffii]EFJ10921.1 hypothetical protein SELMODRAFT_426843 [Selaginella moellendorffii]|eukprot:XP_002988129.1 putative E3 ubiquitin-protein ligase LIN [Selaginella moellendorffii]
MTMLPLFDASIENVLLSSVSRYALDALIDPSRRRRQREAERRWILDRQQQQQGQDREVRYADQAVLANLGWGIDALEEAIQTGNVETKIARLDYAEKMLQVCALLDRGSDTAGISNAYLAASAHMNLALVWKLRSDDRRAAENLLEMFIAEPFQSRVDFAPGLWEALFQRHLTGISSWYSEQRAKLLAAPPSQDHATLGHGGDYSVDFPSYSRDDFFAVSTDEVAPNNLLSAVTPEQAAQLQVLEELYQNTLDDHTRQYAKFYRDCLRLPSSQLKVVKPLLPTAEPPVTDEVFQPLKAQLEVIQEHESDEERDGDNELVNDTETQLSFSRQIKDHESSEEKKQPASATSSKGASLSRSSSFDKTSERSYEHAHPMSRSSISAEFSRPGAQQKTSRSSSFNRSELDTSERSLERRCSLNHVEHLNSISRDGDIYDEERSVTSETDAYERRMVRPPKDFVCPITNQLFDDPVTLETGQTYERTAIREWLERGNTTCPITRQLLKNRALPSTNYVLKRLVENWKEIHGAGNSMESFYDENQELWQDLENEDALLRSSPSSVISSSSRQSQATHKKHMKDDASAVEGFMHELKPAVERLCVSEDLQECEQAVMTIAAVWEKCCGDFRVEASLTKASVIEGLVEVLSVSVAQEVQVAAARILSALVASDEFTRHTIVRADPELESIVRLLKNEVAQGAVLLHQLKLSANEMNALDIVADLVKILRKGLDGGQGQGDKLCSPKAAAVGLLQQLVSTSPERPHSSAHLLLALEAVPIVIENLKAKDIDERLSTISVLLCCMEADGRCRNLISRTAQLGPVVEILVRGSGSARELATFFFLELAHSNRRETNNKVLTTVKNEGILSTMHVLFVACQKAPTEHKHTIAVLMLQLEILGQRRQQSIYKEEALDAIVAALSRESPFDCQVETAEALVALVGRFSYAGTPLTEAWLLKLAGLEQPYELLTNEDPQQEREAAEEKAANLWELNAARVFLEYEGGAILEALGAMLQSKNLELWKPCMIFAVWLSFVVKKLPISGLRPYFRRYFLAPFVVALESTKNVQQKVLAALGLHTFLDDAESMQELIGYAKDVVKPFRQLKKVTWIAQEFIEAFIKCTSLNPMELWQHSEVGQLDVTRSGEVRCLARSKGRLFSGHSDGSIQVWETKKKVPTLLLVLTDHSKAVTSLALSSSSNRLYSASLDRTVRVWAISPESVLCMNVLDFKEAVGALAISGSTIATATPQGNGIKVQAESNSSKQLNSGKHVQCLAVSNGNIYCGCTDTSIQEVDLQENSVVTIQPGTRSLLGKKPVYAIQIFKSEIFSAGAVVEGAAVKVWDQTDYSLKRSLPTNLEIRSIAVHDDFLYLGSSSGIIEVWLRERNTRVSVLNIGSKVNALLLDGDVVYSASEDGKIRIISF